MFGLRKRIEKLEKKAEQRDCDHLWTNLTFSYGGSRSIIIVSGKCCKCKKVQERNGSGKELCNAVLVLDDFFQDIVRTETGIKPKPKK